MKSKLVRKNPIQAPKPVGKYSHVTIIPKDATMYVFSGQIGLDQDDQLPQTLEEQITNTFYHIETILASEGIDASHIVKVNIWATEEIDWDNFDEQWQGMFGDSYPSMTIAYVSALGLPEIKIELDIWAAK
ncbi:MULTISPECIES: RidA family protein [Lysinibacillus]|uniref:RidA family protein n=1 Tax=Lysinibacillus TaxID=400634 RepID=UPI0018CE4414|nr:RidA family protein [Lysinibacillus sphaericus]MBG9692996.1 L-PSP family endoribonuclease [Lysinibacillus sphaericus]